MITGAPPGNNPPALLPSAKTGVYRKRPFRGASVNHRALSLPDVSRLGSPKVIAPSATCGVIARELLPPPPSPLPLVPLLRWRRIPTTLMRARGRPTAVRVPPFGASFGIGRNGSRFLPPPLSSLFPCSPLRVPAVPRLCAVFGRRGAPVSRAHGARCTAWHHGAQEL